MSKCIATKKFNSYLNQRQFFSNRWESTVEIHNRVKCRECVTVGGTAPIVPTVASIPKFWGPQRESQKTKRQGIRRLF